MRSEPEIDDLTEIFCGTYPGTRQLRNGSVSDRYSPQTMEKLRRDPLEETHTKPIVFTLLSIFFALLSWAERRPEGCPRPAVPAPPALRHQRPGGPIFGQGCMSG